LTDFSYTGILRLFEHGPVALKILLFLFSCSLLQPAWAGSPVWLVESNHSKLYVAGTIHLLRASDYPLPAALQQAYRQSRILTFETDIDNSQDPAFARQMAAAMLLPPNTQLQDVISSETLSSLQQYLHSNQLELSRFERFKPTMIALTLVLSELYKIGAGNDGVDLHFFNQAKKDGKTITALETAQQQLEFLSKMGEGQEDIIIQQTLADIRNLQTQFDDMISSWRSGDVKKLETLFVEPMRQQFNPVYQQMLVQRNDNWMPQIIRMLSTAETEMILVGTAHLLGTDGLLFRLRQAGYKITPLD